MRYPNHLPWTIPGVGPPSNHLFPQASSKQMPPHLGMPMNSATMQNQAANSVIPKSNPPNMASVKVNTVKLPTAHNASMLYSNGVKSPANTPQRVHLGLSVSFKDAQPQSNHNQMPDQAFTVPTNFSATSYINASANNFPGISRVPSSDLMPDLLDGFDKHAASLKEHKKPCITKVLENRPTSTAWPKDSHFFAGATGESPYVTSKSFDDLHQFGAGISHLDLNASSRNESSSKASSSVGTKPNGHTPAAHAVVATVFGEPSATSVATQSASAFTPFSSDAQMSTEDLFLPLSSFDLQVHPQIQQLLPSSTTSHVPKTNSPPIPSPVNWASSTFQQGNDGGTHFKALPAASFFHAVSERSSDGGSRSDNNMTSSPTSTEAQSD